MELQPGHALGPYQVLSFLGQGAMGCVYRAHDPRLSRDVAIKVLPGDFSTDPERLRRFELEARAIAQVSDPNIVQIFDAGIHDGMPYLVMELVEGPTLRAWMGSRPLPWRKAVDKGIQLTRGLAAAHDAGIVHRDLKPENVLLGKDGRPRILDFGLARLFRTPAQGSATASFTETFSGAGRIVGTVGYMAPEQLQDGHLDGRTDLFALGVILWEMLTGARPFKGDSAIDTMHAILRHDLPELPLDLGVPPAVERLLRRCLEKEPASRFQNARDLGFALESLLGNGSSASGSATGLVAAPASRFRWARFLVVPAACLLLLAAGLAFRTSPPRAPRFTTITPRSSLVQSARFSPDGNAIAYSCARSETDLELQIFRFLPGEPFPVATGQKGKILALDQHGEAFFTAQGFGTNPGASDASPLYRWLGQETQPREWVKDVQDADVTPNGRQTVVIRFRDGSLTNCTLECPPSNVLATSNQWMSWPRFSPDGGRIAFIRRGPQNSWAGQAVVIDLKGKVLFESRPLECIASLAWGAQGKGILFTTRDYYGAKYHIASCDFGNTVREVLRSSESLFLLDASSKGQLLVCSNATEGELLVEGGKGPEPFRLPFPPAGAIPSPDGSRIAVTAVESGGKRAVYIAERSSGRITPIGRELFALGISDDNQRILVRARSRTSMDAEDIPLSGVPIGPGDTLRYQTPNLKEGEAGYMIPGTTQVCLLGYHKSWATYLVDVDKPPRVMAEVLGIPLGCGYLSRSGAVWVRQPWASQAPVPQPGLTSGDVPIAWDPGHDEIITLKLPFDPQKSAERLDEIKDLVIERCDVKTGRRRPDRTLHMARGEFSQMTFPSRSGRPYLMTRVKGHGRLYLVDGWETRQ